MYDRNAQVYNSFNWWCLCSIIMCLDKVLRIYCLLILGSHTCKSLLILVSGWIFLFRVPIWTWFELRKGFHSLTTVIIVICYHLQFLITTLEGFFLNKVFFDEINILNILESLRYQPAYTFVDGWFVISHLKFLFLLSVFQELQIGVWSIDSFFSRKRGKTSTLFIFRYHHIFVQKKGHSIHQRRSYGEVYLCIIPSGSSQYS